MRLSALAVLLAMTGTALADAPAVFDEHDFEAELGAVVLVEMPPLVFGVLDLLKRPTSKLYGGVEIVWGAGALALNGYQLVNELGRQPAERDDIGFLVGLAVIDAAVVTHGIYTLARGDRNRGLDVAPTVVSTSRATAAGLEIRGSF